MSLVYRFAVEAGEVDVVGLLGGLFHLLQELGDQPADRHDVVYAVQLLEYRVDVEAIKDAGVEVLEVLAQIELDEV
jgi:hypothetical protein